MTSAMAWKSSWWFQFTTNNHKIDTITLMTHCLLPGYPICLKLNNAKQGANIAKFDVWQSKTPIVGALAHSLLQTTCNHTHHATWHTVSG
jgi:hypothetical protein